MILCSIIIFFSSCGTTRAVVRNGTDSAVTTISITTNNPVQVETNPNVSPVISPLNENKN